MSPIQIAAIIQLLIAFGVGQPTVDRVQSILVPPAPTSTVQTATPQSTPQEPQFSGTLQSVTPTPQDKSGITVETVLLNTSGHGLYAFKVRVTDSEGTYIKGAQVTFNGVTNPALNMTSGKLKDYYAEFSYQPTDAGSQDVSFTSGNLTKSVTIEVQ